MISRLFKNCRKYLSVILLGLITISGFSGCNMPDSLIGDGELHRFVTEWRADETAEDSLGEIVTEGEFYEVDPDNMLCYKGAYKGLDYVTLVFDSSSPVNVKNAELCVSEHRNYNYFLEGVLYQEKDGNKYITFKYETIIYENGGQHDAARGENAFILPTKADEPMSYYYICIKPLFNNDYEAIVSEGIQKEVVDRGYYTDYRYDETNQYYDIETNSWTEETLEDLMTDNMPLE